MANRRRNTTITHEGATKQSEERASRLMIQRGSLLTQLFALITLMKHLISPRVLQAAGVWPISAPSLTRISLPSTLPSPHLFLRISSNARDPFLSFHFHPSLVLLFPPSPTTPRCPLITALRLGPFTPVTLVATVLYLALAEHTPLR